MRPANPRLLGSGKNGPEEGFESVEEAFRGFAEAELDYYFDSYSRSSIHHDMLNDKVRTRSYQNAILKNKHLFRTGWCWTSAAGPAS